MALACVFGNFDLARHKGPDLPPDLRELPPNAIHTETYRTCVDSQLTPNGLSDPSSSQSGRGLREIAPGVPSSWLAPSVLPESLLTPHATSAPRSQSAPGESAFVRCLNYVGRSWLQNEANINDHNLNASAMRRLGMIGLAALGVAGLGWSVSMGLTPLLRRLADRLQATPNDGNGAPRAADLENGAALVEQRVAETMLATAPALVLATPVNAAPAAQVDAALAAAPAQPAPHPSGVARWLDKLLFGSGFVNAIAGLAAGTVSRMKHEPSSPYRLSFDVRGGDELSELQAKFAKYRNEHNSYTKTTIISNAEFSFIAGVLFIFCALFVGRLIGDEMRRRESLAQEQAIEAPAQPSEIQMNELVRV